MTRPAQLGAVPSGLGGAAVDRGADGLHPAVARHHLRDVAGEGVDLGHGVDQHDGEDGQAQAEQKGAGNVPVDAAESKKERKVMSKQSLLLA